MTLVCQTQRKGNTASVTAKIAGRFAVFLVAALLTFPAAPGDDRQLRIVQTGSPRVETSEGQLKVTLKIQVQDAEGNVVRRLPAGEFVIYEDGKEVHRFRPQAKVVEEREVMLVLDTSGSMVGTPDRPLDRLQKAKEAAEKFLTGLSPETACGLVLFHHETYRTTKLERSNRKQLVEVIRAARGYGGTAYLDAAYEAMKQFSSDKERSKSIVLLTDGRDVNSRRALQDVIDEARRRNVSIYTIGLGKPGTNLHVRSLLILDRSSSMYSNNKIGHLRYAASRFVELMPSDHADCSILAFSHTFSKPEPPTTNKDSLLNQIRRLTPGGGTALYDATLAGLEWLAKQRLEAKREVRQVAILLTDGQNTSGSIQTEKEFFERIRAYEGIPIFVIGLGDPERPNEIDEDVLRRTATISGGRYYNINKPEDLRLVFEQLSIDIHDEGIDEDSLKRLAEETGGRYFHAEQADQLAREFSRALEQIETSYTISYISPRRREDGTPSRIEIRLGDIRGEASYATHWVVTPTVNLWVFLTLLLGLAALGAWPMLLRRQSASAGESR